MRSRRSVPDRRSDREQLFGHLIHLEAGQQTNVAWCVTNGLHTATLCSVCGGECGPLAFDLLLRLLLVIHTTLYGLTVSESGRGSNIEFATSRNVKLRHLVRDCYDQLRAQNYHRE
jgi:hypothetical protein